MTQRAEKLKDMTERRALGIDDFEIRRADANTLSFEGYASLFNVGYDMYGGPDKGGWVETVDPAAFNRTLKAKPDVVFLINHDGMPLARTTSGTLQLSTDSKGLLTRAQLDTRDPEVQSLQVKMERRDMNQMSFAFRTIAQQWNDGETERRLMELSLDRGDVSVVNNGANPKTSSSVRSITDFIEALQGADDSELLAEIRSMGENPVEQLEAAQKILGTLLTNVRPEPSRRLSVAHAQRLVLLDA